MSSPTILQDELELKYCEEEAQRLTKELEQAREVPRMIAREKLARENTMPPLERVKEISRLKHYEQQMASSAAARNLLKTQTRSLLLLLVLTLTTASLIAWGLRLMNG